MSLKFLSATTIIHSLKSIIKLYKTINLLYRTPNIRIVFPVSTAYYVFFFSSALPLIHRSARLYKYGKYLKEEI